MSTSRYKVVAIIYDKRGKKLGEGENSYSKTHPLQAHYGKIVNQPLRIFLHAEIQAIIRTFKNFPNSEPYKISITRTNVKTGNTGLAAPCPICALAIKEAGISRIEYSL